MVSPRLSRAPQSQAGYTLAALAIAVTVMSILTAVALPVWSKAIQREKEEELIARGLQYAEAIRVFRSKFGRAPVRLQELIEVEPRTIRRLWPDPMMEDGEWGLLLENAQQLQPVPGIPPGQAPGSRREDNGRGSDEGEEGRQDEEGKLPDGTPPIPVSNLFGEDSEAGTQVTIGPIMGVVSRSKEESLKVFLDTNRYDQWKFNYQMLAATTGFNPPGGGANLAVGTRPQWIGRPWRPGIVPPGFGQVPGQQPVMQPGGEGFGIPGGQPLPGGKPGAAVKPGSGGEEQ